MTELVPVEVMSKVFGGQLYMSISGRNVVCVVQIAAVSKPLRRVFGSTSHHNRVCQSPCVRMQSPAKHGRGFDVRASAAYMLEAPKGRGVVEMRCANVVTRRLSGPLRYIDLRP